MKQLREEQGFNMKEAANRLGLPYTTYVNYEKGLREPNSEMLINIANFYNCSIDYLLCKSDERSDDASLDAALEIEPFLLSLTGNIYEAQKLQELIDNNQSFEAYQYYLTLKTPSAASLLESMNLQIADTNPHLVELLDYFQLLNAQGQERLCRYAEELTGHPAYQKKKPSEEG